MEHPAEKLEDIASYSKAAEKLQPTQKQKPKTPDNPGDSTKANAAKTRKITAERSAEDANKKFPSDYHPPYKPGTQVTQFETLAGESFVRVHGPNNKARAWMMKKHAIDGLSPKEIQRKFQLPELPTFVSDVNVPKGTKMQYGAVNPGLKGAPPANPVGRPPRQYQALERLPEDSFTNTKPLTGKN